MKYWYLDWQKLSSGTPYKPPSTTLLKIPFFYSRFTTMVICLCGASPTLKNNSTLQICNELIAAIEDWNNSGIPIFIIFLPQNGVLSAFSGMFSTIRRVSFQFKFRGFRTLHKEQQMLRCQKRHLLFFNERKLMPRRCRDQTNPNCQVWQKDGH